MVQPAYTNKIVCRKKNPVDLTNVTKTGDAAAVLSVVDDMAALTAAGLHTTCTSGKVYKLNNSLGVATATADLGGPTVNTNKHSLKVYIRATAGTGFIRLTSTVSGNSVASSGYTISEIVNVTPAGNNLLSVLAPAGSVIYFILPQLVGSSYHMPFAAAADDALSSVSVPSTAATSSNNGLAIPLSAAMTAALSAGGRFTAAALVYMGVSSAEVTADTNILAVNNNVTGGIYAASGGVLKAFDGTNTATVTVTGGWARGEILLIPWWINGAGTNQQIGYKKSAEAAITWGGAADYDGSVNPGTHLRWGYTVDKPIGAIQSQVWGKSVGTDAEILKVMEYAL